MYRFDNFINEEFIDYIKAKIGNKLNEIHKNPKYLYEFDADVRAVSDVDGNLWVLLKNNAGVHLDIIRYINNVNKSITLNYETTCVNDYDNVPIGMTWERSGKTNIFYLGESNTDPYDLNISKTKMLRYKDIYNKVQKKNPGFTFIFKRLDWDVTKEPLLEKMIVEEKIAMIDGFANHGKKVALYKNPKNLDMMDNDVRGAIDMNGNLYVVGEFRMLHDRLYKQLLNVVNSLIGTPILKWYTYLPNEIKLLMVIRDRNKDVFMVADSYSEELKTRPDFNKQVDVFFNNVKIKNPQYKYEK